MKYRLLILCLFLTVPVVRAQQLYASVSSETRFFSSTPLEDIEAASTKAQSLINVQTREVAVKIPVKSFVFPNGLMQEHFNENYMESEKFPHATFKGRINEPVDLARPGVYDVSATGRLNIHGTERDQTIKGKLTVRPGNMDLEATFEVPLADHNIRVPKVVFMKIAEKIAVTAKFAYQPYQKKAQ